MIIQIILFNGNNINLIDDDTTKYYNYSVNNINAYDFLYSFYQNT